VFLFNGTPGQTNDDRQVTNAGSYTCWSRRARENRWPPRFVIVSGFGVEAVVMRVGADTQGAVQAAVRCQLTALTSGSMLTRATISSSARSLRSGEKMSARTTVRPSLASCVASP